MTDTEVSYGVSEHKKPLLCVCPVDSKYRFSFDDKCYELEGHMVNAAAMWLELPMHGARYTSGHRCVCMVYSGSWKPRRQDIGGDSSKFIDIVKRYLNRATALEHLQHEIEYQKSLGQYHGDSDESDRGETPELEMKSEVVVVGVLVDAYAGVIGRWTRKGVTRAAFDGFSSSAGDHTEPIEF